MANVGEAILLESFRVFGIHPNLKDAIVQIAKDYVPGWAKKRWESLPSKVFAQIGKNVMLVGRRVSVIIQNMYIQP